MFDYAEADKHVFRHEQSGSTRTMVRELTKFGLSEIVAPVAAQLAKIKTLDDSVVACRAEGDAALARVTSRIADRGELTDADLADLERFAVSGTRSYVESPITKAVEHARAVLSREAHDAAQAVGPKVFEALSHSAREAIAAFAKVKMPETVVDERSFLDAGLDGRLWDRINPAAHRFYAAHKLYVALRKTGWLPNCKPGSGDWTMWAAPHKRVMRFDVKPSNVNSQQLLTFEDIADVVSFKSNSEMPAPIRLAHSIAKGAGPHMADIDEAARLHQAWLASKQKAERHGSVLFYRGSR